MTNKTLFELMSGENSIRFRDCKSRSIEIKTKTTLSYQTPDHFFEQMNVAFELGDIILWLSELDEPTRQKAITRLEEFSDELEMSGEIYE